MINATESNLQSVQNALAPWGDGESPKCLSMLFNFAQQLSWDFDLKDLVESEAFTSVQSVFFDNNDTARVLLTDKGTGITYRFRASAQGYLPITITQGLKFNLTSEGGGANKPFRMGLFNVPMPAFVWSI